MNESSLKSHITSTITVAKNEIIAEIRSGRGKPGRPSSVAHIKRGPKNTRMMKIERKAVEIYLEVDCHRTIDSCTVNDAYTVWHLPENNVTFSAAAKRNDSSRGYPNWESLCNGVIYWHEQKILKKH